MLSLGRSWARGVGRHGCCRRKDLVLGGRSGLLRRRRIPGEMGNTERRELFLPALHSCFVSGVSTGEMEWIGCTKLRPPPKSG